MNKKLIFIVGSPRSGTTLLLSYLCGLRCTKILYETRCLTNTLNFVSTDYLIAHLARVFDYFDEDIVIEKTPEHVHYLDIIEQLSKVCKRDIHVIYLTRPPVPTILSILRAKEVWTDIDMLGACEKYEESMISIYHNLVIRHNNPNYIKRKCSYIDLMATTREVVTSFEDWPIPYSFHITYRGLTEDAYFTLYNLLVTELHLDLSDSDIRSIVVNRVDNLKRVLPQVEEESHHSNLFKEVDVVNKERLSNVSSLVKQYEKEISYILKYFHVPNNKISLYDLVINKEVVKRVENPLVTVVVPLYNKEKYIEETLSSLLNQTYQNIRVVVINDASTDSSLEVVRKYSSSLSAELQNKVSILCLERNKDVSYTRNTGLNDIKAQMSDILSFCDADDIWNSTLVEKSVATFKKYPYVDCVYSRVLVEKDGELAKNCSKICNGDVYEDALEYNFLTCGSNIFVKAPVLEEHSIRFNTSLRVAEDWDFLIKLAKIATFKCTKEYLVTYRQVTNSLSTNKELLLEDSSWVLMTHLGVLGSHTYKEEKYSRIFTRLFLYYFSINNLKWGYIKDLDFGYILKVVVSKLKSFVKSRIS